MEKLDIIALIGGIITGVIIREIIQYRRKIIDIIGAVIEKWRRTNA